MSRRGLLVLLVLALLAPANLAAPAGAAAQSVDDAPAQSTPASPASPAATDPESASTPSAGHPTTTPGGGGIDVFALVQSALERLLPDIFKRTLTGFLQMLVDGMRWLVGLVLTSSLNFVLQTPPGVSYEHGLVVALAAKTRAAANAALVLVVLWGGFNVMLRQHLAAPYHAAMELGPRLIVGALLVNTSGWWTRFLVDLNNALCQAVGGDRLPFWDRITTVGDSISQAQLDLYGTLLYLIACLLLVLQMLMRLALVDALLVVAPIGLVCWVLPQTQSWARLWSSTFTSAVFVQFVQVVALQLGGQMLVQIAPGGVDGMVVTPFLGLAALVLALRIPGLVAIELGQVLPRPPAFLAAGVRPAASTARPAGRQLVLKGFERYVG